MTPARPFARIGIVGVGEIGRRMGKRLVQAGHHVLAHDISADALAAAAEGGVVPVRNLAELAGGVQLVITCVTDGEALRQVACGDDGLEAHLSPGIPVLDTTSAEPWIAREVAAALSERGIPFLDAPVSGGVPAAEEGRMNFMVGGDPRLLDALRPVLQHLGPVAMHVGDAGSGHTVKAVNMLALASSMRMTAELVAAGEASGLEAAELISTLDRGAGASYCTRLHYPRFILPGNFASGFTFDLMLKDLSIGIELANRLQAPLHLQRSTHETYRAAKRAGLSGQDNTQIVRFALPTRNRSETGLDASCFDLAALGCNALIAAEAVALGHAAGVAPEKVVDVLSAGSGDSHALSALLGPWLRRGEPCGIALEDVLQATEQICSVSLQCRLPAFLVFQSWSLLAAAESRNRGADLSALFKHMLGELAPKDRPQER